MRSTSKISLNAKTRQAFVFDRRSCVSTHHHSHLFDFINTDHVKIIEPCNDHVKMSPDPELDDIDKISAAGSTRNDRKRNLVNQRNFRSRRKQYIEELEGKVQAYERQGVAASQQVQDAARALIAENDALRSIIFQHLGWRPEYLNSIISQPSDRSSFVPGTTGDPLQHTLSARQYNMPHNIKDEQQPSSHFISNGHAGTHQQQPYPQNGNQYYPHNGTMDYRAEIRPQQSSDGRLSEFYQAINDTNGHSHATKGGDPKAVMSCEKAASILAELSTQGTVDSIRNDLGCKTEDACDVPHRLVFERMDRSL